MGEEVWIMPRICCKEVQVIQILKFPLICGVCRPMTTLGENKCCRKRVFVTSYELFQNICIHREVLTVAIRARCDIRVEEPAYASNSFRKAAYRQYILWRFGKLGRENRKVCPACVVGVIREAYPTLDGQYLGFRRSLCNLKCVRN